MTTRPIRVLAVDDSAVMRGILRKLFPADGWAPELPKMELCGVVEDGVECLASVLRLRPDVVVLDLEMPRMHGLDVLERLHMEEPGLPVIMCSSYTERGARATLEALALGAADYVMKPTGQNDLGSAIKALAAELLPKIAALAAAAQAARSAAGSGHARSRAPHRLSPADKASGRGAVEIVVIGVSTGGPSALESVLPRLGADFPVPVMIVQHMPKLFTRALAERLDQSCALRVREAHDGAEIAPGTIWLAPGDAHMEVMEHEGAGGRRPAVRLHHERSPNHCKPSVDYLFNSAASMYGAGTLALVMTGMGSDGLTGARRVHEAGGVVLAQDEATSAVWGMPGRVFDAGLARDPVPLHSIASELTSRVSVDRNGGRPARASGAAVHAPLDASERKNAKSEVMHGML